MINSKIFNIFRKGSKTFFYSSLFFPASIRDDVFSFYSFVRTADNYVDIIPQQKKQFYQFNKELHYETAQKQPEQFKKFIRHQVKKYRQINQQGKIGFAYLPTELLIPVKTATNMYEWTAEQIYRDPFIVYRTKVKPPVSHILYQLGRNSLSL
jgi:phytoene synthase